MNNEVLWGMLTVVFLIIEAVIPGLISLWFALGALLALIFSVFFSSIVWQITIFITFSIVSMITLRKMSLDKLYKNKKKVDRIIGKIVKVKKFGESPNYGVYLDGKDWTIKFEEEIKVNDMVKVLEIEGNRLVVKKV
ncbi:MAG: NfeD family protein [Fusobacteriaceae bacterium]